MRYQRLFQLRAEHLYYPDKSCTSLAWSPAPATLEKLASYRMQWRALSDGVAVWIPLTAAGQPLIPLAAAEVFRFELRPADQDWHQFTVGPAPGNRWVFSNKQAAAETVILASREESGGGVWGEVEIINNASLIAEKVFTLTISPQALVWRYYVVHDGQIYNDPGKFTIEDGSQDTPALSFPEAQRRSLSQNPDPADAVAVSLLGQLSGKNLLRQSTGSAVAARQKVRRNIRLKYGNTVLISHLPNPAPADRGVKIVYIP